MLAHFTEDTLLSLGAQPAQPGSLNQAELPVRVVVDGSNLVGRELSYISRIIGIYEGSFDIVGVSEVFAGTKRFVHGKPDSGLECVFD
jgi:hypothetical protein